MTLNIDTKGQIYKFYHGCFTVRVFSRPSLLGKLVNVAIIVFVLQRKSWDSGVTHWSPDTVDLGQAELSLNVSHWPWGN